MRPSERAVGHRPRLVPRPPAPVALPGAGAVPSWAQAAQQGAALPPANADLSSTDDGFGEDIAAPVTQSGAAQAARRADGRPQVIAVTSGKGGVGKTSVSVNLAVALAHSGQRVLLLDGDLSLANVDVMLGLTPSHNLSHVLEGQCRLEDTILEGPHGLMVVPAASGKRRMADLSRFENAAVVRVFSELSCRVDTLVVDTAAGIPDSVLTLTAAAQEALVVVTNDPASITDAYALIKVLSKEHGVNRVQVLANQVASATEAQELFAGLERVTERFLDVTLAYAGAVPYDPLLKAAVRRQRPVVDLYPTSPAALAFEALARRVEGWTPAQSRGSLEFFVERMIALQDAA